MRSINQTLLVFLYLGLPFVLSAQSHQFDWVKKLRLNAPSFEKKMVVDKAENIYVTGAFRGHLDFDLGDGVSNLTSADVYKDIFVLKLDAEGNYQWAKSIGKEAVNETIITINVDELGNVYVIGTFGGTVDFDPSPAIFNLTSINTTDYFILKLDTDGNFQWAQLLKDNNNTVSEITAIDFDSKNDVFVYGGFVGDFDFDPGPNKDSWVATNASPFILKMDTNGVFIWAKGILGNADTQPNQLRIDEEDNILITGQFQSGQLQVDPNDSAVLLTSSLGNKDVFIEKLDNDGSYLWAKQIERKSETYKTNLEVDFDAEGNVYTIGAFQGTVDFDTGSNANILTATTAQDVFLQKLDKNGNFQWVHQIKGDKDMVANSIDVNAAGTVFVTGDFNGAIYFDCNCSQQKLVNNIANRTDYFVMSLNAAGVYQWIHQGGANARDRGFSVACNGSGALLTMGEFSGDVDFDPSSAVSMLSSYANVDEIFIQKMGPCTPVNTQIAPVLACNSYIGPNGVTYFESGIYRNFLENSSGCDSIVSFDLTIQSLDVVVSTENEMLRVNHSNASYQWLDCQNNFATIAGATNQQFQPTDARDYAVEISVNDCKDTSACYSVNPTLGLASNLKAHFPFKGIVEDESDNAHPATIFGNVSPTADRANNGACAYAFDGSPNSYISVAPSADFNIAPTGYLSISLWYLGGGEIGPDYKVLFGKKQNQTIPRTFDYTLGLYDLNNPVFEQAWGDINPPHPENVWRHVVGIYKNGDSFIYVDNVLMGQYEDFPFTSNENEIIIGQNFEGKIDDIRFYNRALSEAEVEMLYELPAECFLSTSIEAELQPLAPTVYPNPTNGTMQLDFGRRLEKATVMVTDLIGNTVFTSAIQNQENIAVDLTEYANGLYFIQLQTEGNASILKIIKGTLKK